MTNFIFGAIFGIVAALLLIGIIGILEDRRLSKDFEINIIPKSKKDMIDKQNNKNIND